jgi:hypothetical protein
MVIPKPKFFSDFIIFTHPRCLNRRTSQVSQTRRWVSPIDCTDGDRTAPKLDGVNNNYQQDEGGFYPHTIWPSCNRFHTVTAVSVEKELTWISNKEWCEWRGYRITHLTYWISNVIVLVQRVSLIAYVSGVTGLKEGMLFPVMGSVCPEITPSKYSL